MSRLFFLLLFPFLTCAVFAGDAGKTNSYVEFSASVEVSAGSSGGGGTLLFTLKPVEGIHLNSQPAPTFVVDSSSGVKTSGGLELTTLEKSTFLNPKKPIRQKFTFPAATKAGTVNVKGTLIYYYCSDAEGWCSRFKQPVDLTVTVKR